MTRGLLDVNARPSNYQPSRKSTVIPVNQELETIARNKGKTISSAIMDDRHYLIPQMAENLDLTINSSNFSSLESQEIYRTLPPNPSTYKDKIPKIHPK